VSSPRTIGARHDRIIIIMKKTGQCPVFFVRVTA